MPSVCTTRCAPAAAPRDVSAVTILLLIAGAVVFSAAASAHAILWKRDVRAATAWAGFIWFVPYAGAALYWLFGVNRIRREAALLRATARRKRRRCEPPTIPTSPFGRVGDRLAGTPLTPDNEVEIYATGEAAFDSMRKAIEAAEHSLALSMYIFKRDATGRDVIEALLRAAARGVEVRVLIDAVGSRATGRSISGQLNAGGAVAALFLPARLPGVRSLNLRNHRKLLIVDGRHAYTGGMNIADGYASSSAAEPIRDTQFGLRGPVVRDLAETFAVDWQFTTGESLEGHLWFPRPEAAGPMTARVLADGPDESMELGRWVILGAISAARRHIRIVTPYFLPDITMIAALSIAALRGVSVHIYIPEVLDHRVVKWASDAQLWQVLEKGCRVWFTPPPFDHSKIFTVDGAWSFVGSSNWDTRSMRLNFELNVEVHDPNFTTTLDALIDARRDTAREITLEMIDARPGLIRFRDSLARLLSPYL